MVNKFYVIDFYIWQRNAVSCQAEQKRAKWRGSKAYNF